MTNLPCHLTMLASQRWRLRRSSYRPAGEPIDPTQFGVEELDLSTAKKFVTTHHYSGSYVADRHRVGLFQAGHGLVGAAIFSVPTHNAIIPKYGGDKGCLLGRFVLLDHVAANGESWFLTRALRSLQEAKPELDLVVSYSDPVPRLDSHGRTVMPGHYGCIYQAGNAHYAGRASRKTLLLDPAGRSVQRRALSKLSAEGQGYVESQLHEAGIKRRPRESGAAYVARARKRLRRFQHPGNHTYLFDLNPRRRKSRGSSHYPKG